MQPGLVIFSVDTPLSEWHLLCLEVGLTVNRLFEVTARLGRDAEDLAFFLDGIYPGILADHARGCVMTYARPLLEEVLAFTPEVEGAFRDPKRFCGVATDDEARTDLLERFSVAVNPQSPPYIKNAMLAHLEFGLGEYVAAARHAGYAICNKMNPDFDVSMMTGARDEEMKASLVHAEEQRLAILLRLFKAARRR